jgi:hypothetical protein
LAVGFNNPEVAGTTINANIYPLGIHHEKICESLVNLYDGGIKSAGVDENNVRVYMELKLKMNAGKAEAHAAALQAVIDSLLKIVGEEVPVAPKVTANGDHLSIGLGAEKSDHKLSAIAIP